MSVERLRQALLLVSLAALPAIAQQKDSARVRVPWSTPETGDSSAMFYKGLGYGSDAYNTPLSVLVNKGYDIFQLRRHPRNILTFPYRNAWNSSIRGVVQYPGPAIARFGGWGRFARLELLPLTTKPSEMNWVANYTEHLLVGGFSMRMLDEWFRAHDVPWPRAMAIVTTYASSMINEMAEHPTSTEPGAAGVADLLIFDVAAVTLFHWDQPTRFFARTLELADWSNQASLTYPNQQLQNHGQYFTMKAPIGLDRTRLFLRWGMGAQLGLSRKLDDEHHFSAAIGGDTKVRHVDASGHETVGFALGGGVFYDRNNSLLWSLHSSPMENLMTLNIYPGVLPGFARRIGVWGVYTRHQEFRFGLVAPRALGLGLGYGR